MKLTYVSHASLLMEAAGATVVTDPWFNGPAYFGQWHVFPKPADTSFTGTVSHILLTHGHEDHFHPPTLALMNKNARIYFPYTWKGGMVQKIRSLGFKHVEEVHSYKKIRLAEDLYVTFIVNGLDAFAVYEHAGMVILNLNDALNASHKSFLRLFSTVIQKKWPAIDYLFCGLGGAGYFPNTVHSPLKNDREIGLLREQFLAHKFCELLHELKPKNVIPFVPGFALLEKDKQWINEIKFSRNLLPDYYNANFDPVSPINFFNLLPGDHVEDDKWVKTSPYHQQSSDDQLGHLVQEQYRSEIEIANRLEEQHSDLVYYLADKLNEILPTSSSGMANSLLKKISFGIAFTDLKEEIYIHCYHDGSRMMAMPVHEWPEDANLKITTKTGRLKHALHEEWGGDVFFIGYGADIDILDQSCLKDNLDIVSIRLLSRFPSASHNLFHDPARAMQYLVNNPLYASLAIRQKLYTRGNPNKLPYNERAHWINKSKCDVCRLCDIPLLDNEFGEELALSLNT